MKTIYFSLLISFISALSAYTQKPDDILGVFLNYKKDTQIEFFKKEGKYYGKIVWLKSPNDENGRPLTDINNPNENLRNRKKLGLIVVTGFVYDDNKWQQGEIYDPTTGSTYNVTMWFENGNLNELYLRGYIGVSTFGKTIVWKRESSIRK